MSDAIEILIVDDTPENVTALEALLRQPGVELLKASSGAAALELLLVHDVSLALVDVQMPEMDGFELAELMRGAERTKHVPIIFVTAGARDPRRVFKGYDSGAVDFLYKPIDPHVLRSKVDVFIQLARQRQELANALRLNELFVGTVGHDLRNPLSAIVSGAELLSQTGDETTRRVVNRMLAAGQRMTMLIEQLLDLTRARLGGGLGFATVRTHVDVKELVHRTVDELRGANPNRSMVIETAGDATTTGDPDRLVQLFSNLVGNALAHGARDAPITASIVGSEREVVVTVHNRGSIPPDVLATVFEPFRGRAGRGRSSGLGLGMFIARQIAHAHGGDIGVESTDASGTAVIVRLPRRSSPAVVAPAQRRVLLVEDVAAVRESLRAALEAQQYHVATAANGVEALAVLGSEPPPDVVIFDPALPLPDGNALYRRMQEDPLLARIPVVASSAVMPMQITRILHEVAQLGIKPGITS
ncbi:MAG TPA: response regulator [Kofleriaceae bacterium]|jgi:signal transduction histidine kinase